jgi:hypothetical protein
MKIGGRMIRNSDIGARKMDIQQLYRDAEQFHLIKLAMDGKPKKAQTIMIPVSPRTVYQRIRKSVLFWMAGLFPEAACHYNWVPCTN